MNSKLFSYLFILSPFLFFSMVACKDQSKPPVAEIVNVPEQLDESAADHIRHTLRFAGDNGGDLGDSSFIHHPQLLQFLYEKNDFTPMWSSTEQWKPLADTIFDFITQSKLYGLFPLDYHLPRLAVIRQRFLKDSLVHKDRKDAALWSKADIMLTDAFIQMIRDIKLGRLPNDSITLRKDSVLSDDFYQQQLNIFLKAGSLARVIRPLEPRHPGYHLLKAGLAAFLEKADDRPLTMVPSQKKDSLHFKTLLQKRLYEMGYMSYDSVPADSLELAKAVKKFQLNHNITADGKAGEETLRKLNTSDWERFIQVAITLDKFKLLPEKMPDRFLWVNLPSYTMKLQVGDSVKIQSRIICGKPLTRTPVLTSAITEMITFPQWTVPASIIQKEILPAIKKDPGYLAEKGFSLVDREGEVVDPYLVDWSIYKKGIPYKVVQGSGDDNALGILKFNFPNKYDVYLHDTNQRSLFSRSMRSLSHGCVRVQEWEELAFYLLRGDGYTEYDYPSPLEDSFNVWMERKEKHSIYVNNRLPLFIRYYGCEGTEKGITFFEDIYGEDKMLALRFFAGK